MAKTAKTKGKPAKPASPLMLNGQSWNRPAVMEIVCRRIATSSRSLATLLTEPTEDGHHLPSVTAVLEWLAADSDLAAQYARAKEQQTDFLAEEMLDISDDGRNDFMEANDKDNPGYALNGEHVQRTKLRLETRKWLMAKLRPKKYGEKVQNEHTGAEGGDIQHNVKVTFVGGKPK